MDTTDTTDTRDTTDTPTEAPTPARVCINCLESLAPQTPNHVGMSSAAEWRTHMLDHVKFLANRERDALVC